MALLAAVALVVAFAARSGTARHPQTATLVLTDGTALARIDLRPLTSHGRLNMASTQRRVDQLLAKPITVATHTTRITYSYDRAAADGAVSRLSPAGGVIRVARSAVASTIAAPVEPQRERDDCEATALSMLLASTGVDADQLRLQAQLPTSGPPDPSGAAGGEVWGDPSRGFVGRADGSGPAGGFGVYEHPIQQLAARYGRRLRDLTGRSPAAVYSALLSGHAVMAWVGLADGPYGHWRSPDGREITVNFAEHAILLTGVTADGSLLVNNPLDQTQETWSRAQFENDWSRLGGRALAA